MARAWSAERPRRLLEAIRSGGCSALLSGGPADAVTCRICPPGQAWELVSGYYRGAKQKVCAGLGFRLGFGLGFGLRCAEP